MDGRAAGAAEYANGQTEALKARRDSVAALALWAGAALALLICGGLLVYGSDRGFDLTDESFYLIWASDPNAYALMYQPFGYLLHPLFELVREDLQDYRLAGFAIAAASGGFLGFSLANSRGNRVLSAIYGAAAALTIFFPWIVTPSYNSAANVGAMLVIAGILWMLVDHPARLAAGAVAAGAGLCIAAFAKPPLFAVCIAVIILTACLCGSRRKAAALVAAMVVGAVLFSLFLPLTEAPALVRRIVASQRVLSLPNTPLALPVKLVRDWFGAPLVLGAAAIAAALSFVLRQTPWFRWPAYLALALGLYFLGSIVPDAIDGEIPDFLGLGVIITALGYAGVLQHEQHANRLAIWLLLGAPVAVALGTFNNSWFQLNFSLAFPFLALFALAVADPFDWRRIPAQTFAIAGPVAVMLLAAHAPYSLPASIFDQQVPIRPPLGRGTILVDEETADFVSEAHGLARGEMVIDLSGTGPGVTRALGGKAPALAWLYPAIPTAPDVAWSRLTQQQREAAWFVVPVWPLFTHSAPAAWLMAHKADYCSTELPEMPFWGEERTLELWRPCSRAGKAAGTQL